MYISVQEELTKSDIVITQDVTGKCGMEEHLEKTSVSNNECSSIEESHPGILSSNNNAKKNPLVSSRKISNECASSAENTFDVSSSSVSNITNSGTPSQPTSRRQTFITLEKFDGSENRPFSPSPLNNMSSAITVKNSQEGMAKTDIPPKAKRREVALSKSDSEKIVHGNKRSGLRSSKAEQTGNKSSKLLMTSDQKKNTQESIDSMVALENNPAGLLNQTECVLDNQAHLSESAVKHEDTMLKPTTVNALLENSTVEEKTLGTNLESKENTPPAIIPADQMVNEDSHVPIAPNQKTLRRSLRRRSEIAEPITDSQDKENNLQKKERHKEEEKTLQKNPLHVKDDTLPKQKLISEQTVQENLIEKDTSHEKTLGETSTNTETEKNRRKPDLENSKSEGDGSQDIADKSSEKQVRGRTRYQTRRASQGLLSSIENSESDNSEAKDESSRKKRSGKWKNKNSDSVDIEDQEEKMEKQECLQVESQTHDHKANSEVDINIKSQICEYKDENNVALQNSTVSSDLVLVCDISNTFEEKSKTNKCADDSFSNSVSELNLRTRNANKRLHKRDSIENNNVEEGSKIGTLDISLPSEKTFQTPECRHKRSRRVRRSKGCDCCGEKSQPQEKSPLGLTNTENYNVKVSETKKIDVPTPVTISETTAANIHPEAKLPDECHSVNFHLGLKEENDTTIDSLIVPETELKERDIQDSLPSEIVNFKEEMCDIDFKEAISIESQEPSNKKCKTVGPCLGDSKDISLECSNLETKEEKPEAVLKMEVSTENMVNVETDACKVKAEFNPEVEAMQLDVECDKSEASFSEQKSAKTGIFEEEATEKNSIRSDESEADAAKVLIAEEAVTEEFNSAIGHPDNTTPIEVRPQLEVSEQTAVGGLDGGNDESDPGSSEERNAEMENYEERVIGEVKAETDHVSETEDEDLITKASKSIEAETNRLNIEIGNIFPNTLKVNTEEGNVNSNKTETSIVLNKPEEVKLDDNQMKGENDGETLQEVHHTSEKVKETSQSLVSERDTSELITEDNNTSPQKLSEFDPLLLSATESPSGMQARCIWSPLASPSSSILKRGLKRPQEDEISPPVHKVGV